MPRPIRIKPSAIHPTSPIEMTASRLMSVARSFVKESTVSAFGQPWKASDMPGPPMLDLPLIHRSTEGFFWGGSEGNPECMKDESLGRIALTN
jgi:hypothetical protein